LILPLRIPLQAQHSDLLSFFVSIVDNDFVVILFIDPNIKGFFIAVQLTGVNGCE